MHNTTIKNIVSLTNSPWPTQDPFIFCAYHHDIYPAGNEKMAPAVSLDGRHIGQDFSGKDGWSMYHGETVPGFPAHPHCGFETVSIVKQGFIDHSDSLGGLGRFGNGDVQWLTSGKGVLHAEMFPLLRADSNPMEMFQLWLNLPAKSKKVTPHYKMLWREEMPTVIETDSDGRETKVDVIAGEFNGTVALAPTPDSWAADPANEMQIWTITMAANATVTLPAATGDVNRALYFYEGDTISIEGRVIAVKNMVELVSGERVVIKNGSAESHLLLLQGRPINEPLAQHGPFVANTRVEIQAAMHEYRRTQFGGWPWTASDVVHGKTRGRFATFADGSTVTPLDDFQ